MGTVDERLCRALGRALEERGGIRLGYLFGSRARGDAVAESDVDVAVLGRTALSGRELGELVERLERATGGAVVDVVDLSTAPPLVCDEVVRDGVLVLGSPEDRLEFALRTFQRVQDTAPLRRLQRDLIREAAQHGRST